MKVKDNNILTLQENLFTNIAKTIAMALMKQKVQKNIKSTEFDKDMAEFALKADKLDKALKWLCAQNPNDFRCKEYSGK